MNIGIEVLMIPRYDHPEIAYLWSDSHKWELFLKVELAILQAQEGINIPPGISQKIAGHVTVNPSRVEVLEEETRHDVIAFCTSITEQLPAEVGKYFHFGVTSSDIVDTVPTLQLQAFLQ